MRLRRMFTRDLGRGLEDERHDRMNVRITRDFYCMAYSDNGLARRPFLFFSPFPTL